MLFNLAFWSSLSDTGVPGIGVEALTASDRIGIAATVGDAGRAVLAAPGQLPRNPNFCGALLVGLGSKVYTGTDPGPAIDPAGEESTGKAQS